MVRINLLPIREILRMRELKQLGVVAVGVLVAVFGIMAVAYGVLEGQVGSLERTKAAQQKRLDGLKKENEQINADRSEITRLEKQISTVQDLTSKRKTPAPLLEKLSKAIPEEVWLHTVSTTDKSFTLQGEGIDNTVVVNFVQRLQKLPGEKDQPFCPEVKLVNIVRGKAGGMAFTIQGRTQ